MNIKLAEWASLAEILGAAARSTGFLNLVEVIRGGPMAE